MDFIKGCRHVYIFQLQFRLFAVLPMLLKCSFRRPDDERNSIESAASIRQPVQLRIVIQLISRSLETTDSMGGF